MPLEFEAKAACLDFIPDPQKRLEIAAKTQNPPKFSNLLWFIEIFRSCTGEDGWLDPRSMRSLMGTDLISRRFTPTASSYIEIIEQHDLMATPQLLLPVDLESRLVSKNHPYKVFSVSDVTDFLNGSGRWAGRDFSGRRRNLLEASFQQNGYGLKRAAVIIKNALSEHRVRMEMVAANLR